MRILTDTRELYNCFGELMQLHKKYYWVTPFAKSTFPFIFEMADHESKLEKICIGLNGLETSPTFINEFFEYPQVKYFNRKILADDLNLFLFFSNENKWDLLSGNVYLNKSSFGRGPLLVFHADNKNSDQSLLHTSMSVVSQCWDASFNITEDEYEAYWERWSKEIAVNE